MRRLAKIATVAARAAAIQGLAMLAGRLPPSPGSSRYRDSKKGGGKDGRLSSGPTAVIPQLSPPPARFTKTKTFFKLLFGQQVLDETGRETPLYIW